ncbi:bactofilin family protein [Erwinia sp. BNK-24-b]|uniref:bactofilin family protein n=1 Tax=Erwinia TaxID=551 RepID=UPI001FF024DF|nr:polymer-forming cytoskeletal protein [Erwinia phyllosphaerae]MBV4367287.1 polymer-forming cytoskeletal protein [Erwinia phyllosphaerae]
MNYNLLWYVWIIWASALIIYALSWGTTLMLVRQYWGLLMTAASAVITFLAFRKLTLNKEIMMFKRKESGYHPTAQSTHASFDNGRALPPDDDFEESVSAATIVNAASLNANANTNTATIPETCTIVGEINAVGDIHVNGSVSGKINSEKTVYVQKNGRVDGEIWAQRTEISGELKGLCHSREVAINANGFMDGTIECDSLAVNQLGKFYGQSKPYEEVREKESGVVKNFAETHLQPSQDFHLRETIQ